MLAQRRTFLGASFAIPLAMAGAITGSVAVLNEPAVRQKFSELGATVRPSTPGEFAAFQKTDEAALGDLAAKGLQ